MSCFVSGFKMPTKEENGLKKRFLPGKEEESVKNLPGFPKKILIDTQPPRNIHFTLFTVLNKNKNKLSSFFINMNPIYYIILKKLIKSLSKIRYLRYYFLFAHCLLT